MSTFKDKAIIVSQRDFVESDRIYTLITQKHGKIDAVAKGARKSASRKSSILEITNYVSLSIAKGKNIDIITEAQLINDFYHIKHHLNDIYQCFYISELTNKFIPTGYESREVFYYLLDALKLLNKKPELKVVIRAFEVKLMNILGFGPHTDQCVFCSKPMNSAKVFKAMIDQTGFSDGCIDTSGIAVDSTILKIVKYFIKNEIKDTLKLRLTKKHLDTLEKLNIAWIQSIIGSEIRSAKFIK